MIKNQNISIYIYIVISCLFVFLAYCICPLVLKIARETKTHATRLFTDPYFRVRSSRSSAIRYGLPSWIPDARPLGTFENQDGRH